MFGWLKRLFSKPRLDVYHPRERLIFRYFNGHRTVLADPLVLCQRVSSRGKELDRLQVVARSTLIQPKVAEEHRVEYVAHLRDVFKIPPLVDSFEVGEGGRATLTDTEVEGLLDQFMWFCDSVKKNSKQLRTTYESSQEPPETTSEPAASPTSPTSGSGSTEPTAPSEPPAPSPTGSGSPSAA